MDDSRLDPHGLQSGQMTPIYGQSVLRGASNSNSPGNIHGQSSTLLVVPQPLNATKIAPGLPNGSGRKYQCKMCPQVRIKKKRSQRKSLEYS